MTEHSAHGHPKHGHHASHAQVSHEKAHNTSHLEKPQIGKNKNRNQMGIMTKILLFFIFFSVISALYIGFQNYSVKESINNIKTKIQSKQVVFSHLAEEGQVLEKLKAQETLLSLEESRIEWSKITAIILTSIEKKDEINIRSITASEDMKFTISGKGKNYETIAKLIRTIDRHKNFSNPFVSSITSDIGGKVNFGISFEYKS